jgi:methionyl-tRNA formyltransferase
LGVFEAFLDAGWEPVKLFTMPVDNRVERNTDILARAAKEAMAVQISPMSETDLADLSRRACDVLVVASYNWRIPDWRPFLSHAINFHPSPLPEGRGPYPVVHAILDGHHVWGITCHKIEREFDAGEILAQETFSLHDEESFETLDLRLQMAGKRLARVVAEDFHALWSQARPQGTGSYWKHYKDEDRMLDFGAGIADNLRRVRAFGPLETLARVKDTLIHVRRANGWTECHKHSPGSVVHRFHRTLVVAVRDGYLALLEWSLLDPNNRF